jgi:hypothetical protein
MGTHLCVICSEPVDLTIDPCDETGDPVHKHCYLIRMTGKSDSAISNPQKIIQASQMQRNSRNQVRPHAGFIDASASTRARYAT